MIGKALNALKNKAKQREGPARKDQEAAPIADAVAAYWERGTLCFSIPAHKGGLNVEPEAARWSGIDAYRTDLPMSHGVDHRDRRWQIRATAEELAAEAFGADSVLFSTNGSSMNVHIAMLTVAGPGETIVLARNSHKSAFAGLVMSGARPIYLDPDYDDERRMANCVPPERLALVLDEHPEAKAVFITSPTMYGLVGDIQALADICHDRGLPLVTDDAWGLDYGFHPDLPPAALDCGADLSIASVHKTLTGLSQTSLLMSKGDLIDSERLQLCFDLEESTSASTLLLASIDGARRQTMRDGRNLTGQALAMSERIRLALARIPALIVLSSKEALARPGTAGFDPTHVTIDVSALGLTGYQAADWLFSHEQITFELMDHRRLMALITFADNETTIDRLAAALRSLVDNHQTRRSSPPKLPATSALRSDTVMLPRDAFFGATKHVPIEKAAGAVAAELVTPYPPGVPVLAPGEIVTEAVIDYLQQIVSIGGFVEGTSDPSLKKLRVTA